MSAGAPEILPSVTVSEAAARERAAASAQGRAIALGGSASPFAFLGRHFLDIQVKAKKHV
jgi:hypothetical protein